MKYIDKHYENTLEIKQSKFMAHLVPYDTYETTLKQLKDKHPKARHFVTAFRYLNEYNQIVEHSSDDGEPKGTSGKPSLMVLQGKEIINTAVIIIRYFGGTKLGTGGLVRAYSDAVNLVLDKAELLEYKQEISKKISFSYANIGKVEHGCSTCRVRIINKTFEDNTLFEIKGSKSDVEELLAKLDRLVSVCP
jgi:uncharacterized YigZ family protein